MELRVTSGLIENLVAQAADAHPNECCGILLGGDGRITGLTPARNVHPTPHTHFEIDPQALIDVHRAVRAGGPPVIGYYHSHPNGRGGPSPTDQAMALGDGGIWAIIAENAVSFWEDAPDRFRALSHRVVDG